MEDQFQVAGAGWCTGFMLRFLDLIAGATGELVLVSRGFPALIAAVSWRDFFST